MRQEVNVEEYWKAECALENYLLRRGISLATITLPLFFYDPSVIAAWENVLAGNGWTLNCADINYSLNLRASSGEYISRLWKNGRRNHRICNSFGLQLTACATDRETIRGYNIIRQNRDAKGYPLRMTQQQVLDTMRIVPSTMYLVSYNESEIAAALVYEVTPTVAQVIYWGDAPGYTDKKPVNYLAYSLFNIYFSRGFHFLDVGPSSEFGIPNFGLCVFKDSIGCERSAKLRFSKVICDNT